MLTAGDDSPRPQPDSRFPWQLGHPDSEPAPEPAQVRVRPGSPAELLAIVPHLLGFVPQASLVVMGTEPPRGRVKVTLRYDLPDPPGAGVAFIATPQTTTFTPSASSSCHAASIVVPLLTASSMRATRRFPVRSGELVRVEPEALLVEFMRRRRDGRDGRGEVGVVPEFAGIAHGLYSFTGKRLVYMGKWGVRGFAG